MLLDIRHTRVGVVSDVILGLVEVYHGGEWGTICNNGGFDNNAGNVACRQLGYESL